MSQYPLIKHHGAVQGVTGSCHQLQIDADSSVLIDCGIFQGSDESPHGKANAHNLDIDFPISDVKALIITHCHIDHAGRLPWLLGAGFDAPIYCSRPTAMLLPLMLEDSIRLAITRDRRMIDKLVDKITALFRPLEYQQWQEVTPKLTIRLQPAGHILGSAYVECDTSHQRIVFSGDLGAPHAALLPDPKSPSQCHTLVIESTYGHKRHSNRAGRKDELKQIIERCFENKGAVLIPAFSLGRTQELMVEFEDIIYQNPEQWQDIDVVIDSPLASRFVKVYRQLKPFWDDEAQKKIQEGRYPLGFKQLFTVNTGKEHRKMIEMLSESARPTIIIAASGMCSGGRIMGYLKALIEDARTDILFSGYQAKNTIGRQIYKYGPQGGWVEIDGNRYDIKAKIHSIGGYSAHADQQNLIDFVMGIKEAPQQIRIIHGDDEAKQIFQEKLSSRLPATDIVIP
ncbi:MAG TPA: MBL fold metallo-hydrolase [Thiotrichaceae bacterium]|nr:MBL fold metallo-hydrolase [Thiotrichaceae bacterium]